MLRFARDWQSLLYMALQCAAVAYLWFEGFNAWVYGLVLFLTLGIGVIHHNHAHVPMFRYKPLNHALNHILAVLQGHPSYVFYVTHNGNHHRYVHSAKDAASTYHFGGDHNHLWGYLTHPIRAVFALYPLFWRWLMRSKKHNNRLWKFALGQYALVLGASAGLAYVDVEKWVWFVLIPQLHGLHWLLATNYLQHAHADGNSGINFARNFDGWLNPLLFNIGLHTAHHKHAHCHWSLLPSLHLDYQLRVHPKLQEGGLAAYMMRTYVLSIFFKRFRSQTLMKA